jgi:hypothetical protein
MKIQDIPGFWQLSPLQRLAVPFTPEQVKWRPGSTTGDGTRGMALAYIDARDVMDRLNLVMGPENWETHIKVEGGIILCSLTLHLREPTDPSSRLASRVARTRTDGAGETAVEGEKGGISDALKRSAVQWGIGRYLYALPSPWVAVENRRLKETPPLPSWALPENWIARLIKEQELRGQERDA